MNLIMNKRDIRRLNGELRGKRNDYGKKIFSIPFIINVSIFLLHLLITTDVSYAASYHMVLDIVSYYLYWIIYKRDYVIKEINDYYIRNNRRSECRAEWLYNKHKFSEDCYISVFHLILWLLTVPAATAIFSISAGHGLWDFMSAIDALLFIVYAVNLGIKSVDVKVSLFSLAPMILQRIMGKSSRIPLGKVMTNIPVFWYDFVSKSRDVCYFLSFFER